jgi:hypothetical protein
MQRLLYPPQDLELPRFPQSATVCPSYATHMRSSAPHWRQELQNAITFYSGNQARRRFEKITRGFN